MNYNLGTATDVVKGDTQTDKYLKTLRRETKTLPEDREGLIWAYAYRFIPMAAEEFIDYSEIETVERAEALINKYGIREKAQQIKGDKERLSNLIKSMLANKELQEDNLNFLMDFAFNKATDFVTSKRNRLRAKALLLMGEEQLNEKELAYLREEGEFWYNETEE